MANHTLTHWGAYVVHSDGADVTAVDGHPHDPEPSPIGQSLKAATASRIHRPAIRRSWLEGGPGAASELRGVEPFVEVDWDEATELVAAELARVRSRHGNGAIYAGSYGWSSAGRLHAAPNLLRRLLRLFGGYTDAVGTYSSAAASVIIPHVIGMAYDAAVAAQTSWSVIADHTELIVAFGGIRASNAQVTFGGQGPHHTRDWLVTCRDRGVRFVNISPIRDDVADELGGRWLALRPGTDTAVMLGLMHTLASEGLADLGFLERYCVGWAELRRYLDGDVDGEAKTARWAERVADLPTGCLTELAREMASSRTLINLSLSIQRGHHGEQPYWAAAALAAALGQIGLPGGGFGFPYGANGNVGAGRVQRRVPNVPVPPNPLRDHSIPVARVVDMLEAPGATYRFDGETRTYPDIRLVYWCGGNVFHHHQDLNRLRRAWRRPETIVVHDPFWTPTARHADIVLPATTPLERDDLGAAGTLLIAMSKAIEPVGEAHDDYDILADVARRLGVGEAFTEGRTSGEWLRALYELFRVENPEAPPFEVFWSRGYLVHAMEGMGQPYQVFLEAFRSDPERHPLATPSGRIELCSRTIAGFGDPELAGHPAWTPPYEWLGSPDAGSSLHLVSNQPARRLHSQYDHGETSQAAKLAGREPLRLHPDDAAARGVGAGDVVRVVNARGSCLAAAVLSDAVRPGVVEMAVGAWYDPEDPARDASPCKHGNPNVVTRDVGTSPLAQGPTAHTCLVRVERYRGTPPPVTAYDPPALVERRGPRRHERP